MKKTFVASTKRFTSCFLCLCLVVGFGGGISVFATDGKVFDSEAPVGGYNYNAKVRVMTDESGNITGVMDNGTRVASGSEGFWSKFVSGGGFEKFVGKNKITVDSVEAVTGATATTEAVKTAVKKALEGYKPPQEKEPNKKLIPGEHKGEVPFPYMNDSSRKVKVKVTVGENGTIEKVVNDGTSKPSAIRQGIDKYWKLLGKENWFKGLGVEDVKNMHTTFPTSPQVPGGTEQWGYAAIAKGVQLAVLNALGEKIPDKVVESESDQVIESEAPVVAEPYKHRLKVRLSEDGRVVSVADNKTIVRTPQGSIIHDGGQNVTTDDEKRIKKFEEAKGYEMFVGKSLAEIKSIEIGKHGVDTVAGATFTTAAVRQGIVNAFKKGGYPDQAPIEIKGKEYTGESKTPIAAINKIAKVRIIVDANKRIIRAYDNKTFPGERTQESSRGPADNDWDRFAKFRGFARFNGRNLKELKEMKAVSKDSIYVAGGTTQIFEAAKEAVINALEKAEKNLNREPLQKAIASAEKSKEGVIVSVDGTDVSPDRKWVDKETMNAFDTAIGKAKDVYAKLDDATNQEELNAAIIDIDDAAKTFNKGLKPETKSGEKPETKLTPGEKKGVYKEGSSSYEVNIKLNKELRIEKIDVTKISAGFSAKNDAKDFTKKHKAHHIYLGMNLQDVISMDVNNNMGAHVPGNAPIDQTAKYFAKISQGVRMAVLNAMGYEIIKPSPSDRTFNAEANTNRYNYAEKITLKLSSDGRVVSVGDNGTKVQSNYKTSDNLKRLELFEKGKGFDKYIGKNLPQIKAMDISKHGVDSVAGATFTSNAVRDAVINGYKAAGYDTSVAPLDPGGKEYFGESKSTFTVDSSQHKAKVRLLVDKDGRIIKTINNNSVPGERTTEKLDSKDNQWDKFAKARGFAKFNGKNIDEVKSMDMDNADSIFVAGKQVEISKAAKEAVIDALEKVSTSKEPVSLDNINAEIKKAKESMEGVKTSSDGSDVPNTGKWVTPQVHKNLLDEILKAEEIAHKPMEELNKEDIDNATNSLHAALEAFNSAKKAGNKAPKVERDALKDAIKKAETLMASVKISADGTDVDPKDKWVTEDDIDVFKDEIDNAKSIAESEAPETTQNIVDETLKQLQTAKVNFEEKIKPGTKKTPPEPKATPADLTALNKAIENAKAAIKDVKTSKDGKDIAKTDKWVTPEAMKAMTDKIAEAEALVKTKPNEDKKADVEKMTADLKKLTEEFKPVAGLKEERKPNPGKQPDSGRHTDPGKKPGNGSDSKEDSGIIKPGMEEPKIELANADDLTEKNNLSKVEGKYIYTKGISKGLSLRIINTNPDRLKDVLIDGQKLTKDTDYTVVKGSILLHLKKGILDKFADGNHEVTAKTEDGDFKVSFVIKTKQEKKISEYGKESTKSGNTAYEKATVKPNAKSQPVNTGDSAMAVGYGMLAMILAGATYFVVRKRNKQRGI